MMAQTCILFGFDRLGNFQNIANGTKTQGMYPLIWSPTESVLRAMDYASGFLVPIFRNVTAVVFDAREARRHRRAA